jgi:hypothetical protein
VSAQGLAMSSFRKQGNFECQSWCVLFQVCKLWNGAIPSSINALSPLRSERSDCRGGGASRCHATGTIAAHCSFVLREGTVNQTPQIEIEQRKGERRDDQRASQRLNRSCGPSPFNRVTYAECGLRTIRETTCFILTPLESLARCRT